MFLVIDVVTYPCSRTFPQGDPASIAFGRVVFGYDVQGDGSHAVGDARNSAAVIPVDGVLLDNIAGDGR